MKPEQAKKMSKDLTFLLGIVAMGVVGGFKPSTMGAIQEVIEEVGGIKDDPANNQIVADFLDAEAQRAVKRLRKAIKEVKEDGVQTNG